MKTIKTVLVEDHAIFRLGLKAVLESAGIEVCSETGQGKEALSIINNTLPDVVIIDIGLPDISGIKVIEQIRKAYLNKVKIIVVTGVEDKKAIKEVFKKGATSFFSKSNTESKIVDAVRATYRGESWIDTNIHTIMAEAMWEVTSEGPTEAITKRELDVLKLLARGLTYEEMANKLCLEISTVRSHAHRIIGKLDRPEEDGKNKRRPTRGKAVCEALRLGILKSEDLTQEVYNQPQESEFTHYDSRKFLAA
ncbi:two-component response regulator [Calothrix sp. PCC 7716]|nr:two-component response regulator [Calothrix sp. PCC 7716]